jgi:hypothetical protein
MKTFVGSLAALLLLVFGALAIFADSGSGQRPVFIVLYSRFYDHSHQHTTDERLQRLLPMLAEIREKYPQYNISTLLQFSGTVAEKLDEENSGLHLVDRIKDYASRGWVEVGYTGEEEPSYLYRPTPNLLLTHTPEEHWKAEAEASERFLTDFKNPVTGRPLAGLSGGLKRTQEVFGPAVFATGIASIMGGDSATTHEFRRLDPTGMLVGMPPGDQRRGIEGYGFSADNFSKYMSPVSEASPEVFWEDGVLRLSDVSLNDNRPHNTDETVDALKKFFQKLNRSQPRVIKVEIESYRRYLTKRADGSVLYDPMEWMYYHPDNPLFPVTMKPLVDQDAIEKGFHNEQAVLSWLVNDFLPANPGSRFLSIHELQRMTDDPAGSQIPADDVRAAAADIDARFKELPMQMPRFVHAGQRYFSDAEAFQILAESLAGMDASRQGPAPASVKLTKMYGPLQPGEDMGPIKGQVTVAEVIRAAARIAPALANDAWQEVPDNAVPGTVEVGATRVNASQFLHLMAWAYLNPAPDRILQLNAMAMTSSATFMYPHNVAARDMGNGWTFKPAPLKLPSAATTTAAN